MIRTALAAVTVVANLTSGYLILLTQDRYAFNARPAYDMPRAVFCGALLGRSDWRTGYGDDPLAQILVNWQLMNQVSSLDQPVPIGRVFAGPRGAIDLNLANMIVRIDDGTRERLKMVGREAIERQISQLDRQASVFHDRQPSAAGWLGNTEIFREYQVARFAGEVPELKRLLEAYERGQERDKILLVVSRVTTPVYLSGVLFERFWQGQRGPDQANPYFWHFLSYDDDLKKPVWRLGVVTF